MIECPFNRISKLILFGRSFENRQQFNSKNDDEQQYDVGQSSDYVLQSINITTSTQQPVLHSILNTSNNQLPTMGANCDSSININDNNSNSS